MALGFGFSFLHHPLLVEAKAAWGQCGDGSPDPSARDDQTLTLLGIGSYRQEGWKNMAGGSFPSLSGGGDLHWR